MLQARILTLQNETDTHFQMSQARDKHDDDRRVCETQSFHTGEYVSIDEPPLSNVSDSQTETLERKPHEKLQSKTTKALRNVSVQKSTHTIDKDGIPITETIDRAIHAPSIADRAQRATTMTQPKLDVTKNSTASEAHSNDAAKDESLVERIV